MKLIFCKKCKDLFRLFQEPRSCKCGQSGGWYVDEVNAEYFGEAVPLGIANDSFVCAIKNQPKEGMGKRFDAFVIPQKCQTFINKKRLTPMVLTMGYRRGK